jgi:AraC-like DNA-binding protein
MVLLDHGGRARGEVRVTLPAPDLATLVEHVWAQSTAAQTDDWRVVPDASPYLIAAIVDHGAGRRLRIAVVGPRSRAAAIDLRDRVATVGVRLHPGALPAVTGMTADAFADMSVPVGDVVHGQVLRELELSADAPEPLLASELLRLVRRAAARTNGGADTESFRAVLADASRVRHAAAALLTSERTLRDRVRRTIGLSPKKTLRIVRLHRALHLARRHAVSSWADVAHMSEYADQPHFVRECQDLLGESPSAWAARGSADSFKTACDGRT